jgi:AcrR family transcriptional regulator
LFRARGFEATTVREIGVACELSEATFFNYFPAKDAVLSAWAHGVVERHLQAGDGSGDRGLRSVLRGLCDSLGSTIEGDRDFAARAWARARVPTGPPEVMSRVVKAGQDAGQLRRDLSARQLGGILYISICGTIADWLSRDEPRGPLASELRRATDLVLDGSRRRNERVRPTPRATPASTR